MSEASDIEKLTYKWIEYAQRDLRAAQKLIEEGNSFTSQVCFHCQQTAEKSLKAALVFNQIKVPFIHDLDKIRSYLPQDWQFQERYSELGVLSDYAVDSRYPDLLAKPSYGQAEIAIQQAEEILILIQQIMIEKGLSFSGENIDGGAT